MRSREWIIPILAALVSALLMGAVMNESATDKLEGHKDEAGHQVMIERVDRVEDDIKAINGQLDRIERKQNEILIEIKK